MLRQLNVWLLLNETERKHFSATLFLWGLLFLVDVLLVLVASLPSTCPCPPEHRIVVEATVLLSVLGHFPIVFPGQRRGKIFGLYRADGLFVLKFVCFSNGTKKAVIHCALYYSDKEKKSRLPSRVLNCR